MTQNLIYLIFGFIIGSTIASIIWAVLNSRHKKQQKLKEESREQVIVSISEMLADADVITGNLRCGAIDLGVFRRDLNEKINAVTRIFRTNMHLLDVYFVKYAEQQVAEYMRIMENPERRRAAFVSIDPVEETAPAKVPEPNIAQAIGVSRPLVADSIDVNSEKIAAVAKKEDFRLPEISEEQFEQPEEVANQLEAVAEQFEAVLEQPKMENIPAEPEFIEPLSVEADVEAEIEAPAAPFEVTIEEVVSSQPEEIPASIQEKDPSAEQEFEDQSLEEYEASFAQFEGLEEQPEETSKEVESVPEESPKEELSSEIEEDVFELTPPQTEEETGTFEQPKSWSEQSFDEFEASFAQFEAVVEQQSKAAAEVQPIDSLGQTEQVEELQSAEEDVTFQPQELSQGEESKSLNDMEKAFVGQGYALPSDEEDEVLTETICFDRPVMPVAGNTPIDQSKNQQPKPPVRQAPPPPIHDAPAPVQDSRDQTITGDDVIDSIDSFFGLR